MRATVWECWAVANLSRPQWAIALVLAVTVLAVAGLFRLGFGLDGRSLLPSGHPALVLQAEVETTYAATDFLVVGIAARDPDGTVFSPGPLNWVLHLTSRLQAMPEVQADSIQSLATIVSPSWSKAGLRLSPLLVREVSSAEQGNAIRQQAEADPLLRGLVVSPDGRAAAIYVPVPSGAERLGLLRAVREESRQEFARLQADEADSFRLYLLGPAAAESLLGEYMVADLALLVPISLCVIACALWLWFRRVGIVLVGLGEAGLVMCFSLGLMGMTGYPLTLPTAVMPVILATYCVSDTVHLTHRYDEKRRAAPKMSRREAMRITLEEITTPVLFSSLSTAVGFLAFAITPIPPLQAFGLFSAAGVLYALGISLFVVPPALTFLAPVGIPAGRRDHPRLARLLPALALGMTRHPVKVVVVTLATSAAILLGTYRLLIQDSWVKNFDSSSELARSEAWFNDSFLGSNILNIVIDAGPDRAALRPDFLEQLERLKFRLGAMPEVGGVRSVADHLRAVSRALEGKGRLPSSLNESEEWVLFHDSVAGRQGLKPFLNEDASAVNLCVFLRHADYRKTAAVKEAVEAFAWESDGPAPRRVRFSGDAHLGHVLVDSITASQISSFASSVVMVWVLAYAMLRNALASLLTVLPVSLSVVWNFGFMGWADIPLGVATSTFSAIAVGVGIDFALHWIVRLRAAYAEDRDWLAAVRLAGATPGLSIVMQDTVLLVGFGTLLFSSVPPNHALGILMCLNLICCMAATLVVLPAVATLCRHRLAGWLAPACPACETTPAPCAAVERSYADA